MAHLVGTHSSDFFKINILIFYLKILKKIKYSQVQFLAKIRQIANFAKFSTRKQKCP